MATAKKKAPVKAAASKKAVPAKKGAAAAPAKKGIPPKKPGTAKKPARKPLPTFEAPADFKPHFLLLQVRTEADGLLGPRSSLKEPLKAIRYQGGFEWDKEEKKMADMLKYDPLTVAGIMARLAGVTFKPSNDRLMSSNVKQRNTGGKIKVKGPDGEPKLKVYKSTGPDGKPQFGAARLPKNTTFSILMRVGRRSADNALTVGIKTIWQSVKNDAGRITKKELAPTDAAARLIKRAKRYLPAAFVNVQMPPKVTRRRKADVDEADED